MTTQPRVLTMGVELEMAIHGGATTQLIANVLTAAGVPATTGPYTTAAPGLGPAPWHVTTDDSVVSQAILDEDAIPTPHPGPRGTYAIESDVPGKDKPLVIPHATAATGANAYLRAELISRPFEDDLGERTEQWHQEIHRALDALDRSVYVVDTNRSAGFHVHIGVGLQPEQAFTLEEAQKISALFLAYEGRIDRLHPEHRVGNPWAMSNVENVHFAGVERPSDIVFAQNSVTKLVKRMCPARPYLDDPQVKLPTKCYKLNLWSLLDATQTVEWRQHEATTDPRLVCRWADFTLAFIRKALAISKEELLRLEADKNASIFDDPLLRKAYFGTAE